MNRTTIRQLKTVDKAHKLSVDPFVENFNMRLAKPQSKSVRLNGFATCLRLEDIYWKVLECMARTNGCSVNAILSHVDREVHLRYGGVKNFSGLIRVVCVVHLLTGSSLVSSISWNAEAEAVRRPLW